MFITWTALQYLYYNLGASSLPTKYCTICYASHGNERLICGWSNKLIITAKSQASSSNYKIAQASKKFQIPNPFSLPLLRKYEMEKWLTFNLYCIHISKKRDYCDYFNIHVHYGPNIFLNAHELLNTRLYQQKTPMYFNPKGLV